MGEDGAEAWWASGGQGYGEGIACSARMDVMNLIVVFNCFERDRYTYHNLLSQSLHSPPSTPTSSSLSANGLSIPIPIPISPCSNLRIFTAAGP